MDGFESFVRTHGPGLSKIAYLLCGDRAHAEDLVQVAFWKAHRAWERLESVEHPQAYMRQILMREYLSWRRRRWTTEFAAPGELLTRDDHRQMADHSDRIAELDAVRRLLDSLPRKQRAVLVMRYYLDLADDDIAAELRCSRATVRSIASRALQSLRQSTPTWEVPAHESE